VKVIAEERLSDRLAVGLLAWTYPPEMIERAIRRSDRLGARNRLLPPLITVYFVMVMCLFPNAPYEQVAQLLSDGLPLADPMGGLRLPVIPSTAALSRARMRLGAHPLRELFADAVEQDLAEAGTLGPGYRAWRPLTLDGRARKVSDTAEAEAPAGARTPHELRISVLAENSTGLLLGAEIAPAPCSLLTTVPKLLRRIGPGDLLLAEAEFACWPLWPRAVATGADLLWSVPESALPLTTGGRLPDGSQLCTPPDLARSASGAAAALVRVIGPSPGRGGRRLVTTILDPVAAPAPELWALHAGRWSFTKGVGDLQAFRNGPKKPLRSRSPEAIEQELWGNLLLYRMVRNLANKNIP